MSDYWATPSQTRDALAPGAAALLEVMHHHDVGVAFGVVSVHNMPLVDGIQSRARWVPVRHEAAAVNAADGASRATRGLGVAVTSTGTGAGNAAGSLVEALTAGASVLHVTGQIESEYLGRGAGFIHETRDQLGMLTAISKQAFSLRRGHNAGANLHRAAAHARSSPTGPVSVEWPIDLQYAVCGEDVDIDEPLLVPTVDDEAIDRAVELIVSSRRPVVWAGGGAIHAREELSELLDRLGASLLTSNAGRGVINEDDVRVVGNYGSLPAGQELLDHADLLISLGTHFRSNETHTYKMRIPLVHIQVDVDPPALGRAYPCTIGLVGDTAAVVRALLDRLAAVGSGRFDPEWRHHGHRAREAARHEHRQALGVHAYLSDAIRDVVPCEGLIARDVTIATSTWGNRLLPIHEPATNLYARGGGIGQGLAMGLGGALASGRPGVVIAGDGGLAAYFGELLTLAQEAPHLCVIVFNDGGYGVLRNMQDAHFGRRSGVDLATPSFSALADAVGLPFARVRRADEMRPTLGQLLDQGRPTLLEVDLDAIGPMPQPFTPPVDLPPK